MLETVDAGDKPRLSRVHNSLTLDGLSAPVHPKGKKTMTALTGREAVGKDLNVRTLTYVFIAYLSNCIITIVS